MGGGGGCDNHNSDVGLNAANTSRVTVSTDKKEERMTHQERQVLTVTEVKSRTIRVRELEEQATMATVKMSTMERKVAHSSTNSTASVTVPADDSRFQGPMVEAPVMVTTVE